MLVVAAALYGLAVFVVDIEILGRTAFPVFTNPHGRNQVRKIRRSSLRLS